MKSASTWPTWTLIVLALVPLAASYAIYFQSLGMDQAFEISANEMREHRIDAGEQIIEFAVDGPPTYVYVADHFGIIFWLWIICLGVWSSELIQPDLTIGIKCLFDLTALALLVGALWQIKRMLIDASYLPPSFFDDPRNHLLRTTVTWDWLLLILVTVSLLLNLYSFGTKLLNGRLRRSSQLLS
jgi:hypothetical protein